MKLVMTLLVRDEEDIVAANLDFHLAQGVDFFIATDNLSVDRTSEILRSYERRGRLHYIYQSRDNYAQHEWVTHMARLARTEFSADWVINNDADEFWWPEYGDLKQVLGSVPPSCNAAIAQRVNFLPRAMADGDCFAEVMTLRECQSLNALGRPLPAKVCHRADQDIEVKQGNHSVRMHGQAVATLPAAITILHFPMRSYRQFANKIARGGAAYERNTELSINTGETWRYLHEIWRKGEMEAYYLAAIAKGDLDTKNGRAVFDDRLKRFFSGLSANAD